MAEPRMGPRDYVNAEFTRRAWQDEAFRDELLNDPRVILPPRPVALSDAVIGLYELADREVAGYADKDYSTGYRDCHACVGGVRG